jgi:hypothetical protein
MDIRITGIITLTTALTDMDIIMVILIMGITINEFSDKKVEAISFDFSYVNKLSISVFLHH